MKDLAAPLHVVIPGGSGHVGRLLTRALIELGHRVTILGRSRLPSELADLPVAFARWDGRTAEPSWTSTIDGADAVVNLAGRTVDCRYHKRNLSQMLFSRIDSTRAVGRAIAAAKKPPRAWLQMSTATIYAHRTEGAHDEVSGVHGGNEPCVPEYWRYSVHIAEAWERELMDAPTPSTRRVAMRSAMVMAPGPGGPFRALERLARFGLGGPIAGGELSISWIHDADFVRAVLELLDDSGSTGPPVEGPVNLAAPEPLHQRTFMAAIRAAQKSAGRARVPFALPAARWMIHAGAVALRTDPELILKSRRVTSSILSEPRFSYRFPRWKDAALDLVQRL